MFYFIFSIELLQPPVSYILLFKTLSPGFYIVNMTDMSIGSNITTMLWFITINSNKHLVFI